MPVPERFAGREDALAWLDTEHENLVDAVGAAAVDHPATAVLLAVALAEFLDWRRRFDEWIAVSRIAVAAARQLGDKHAECRALTSLGIAQWKTRQFQEAIDIYQQALAIARETGDVHSEGRALTNLGIALWEMRRFDDAINLHQQAVAAFRQTGDLDREGRASSNLGLALQDVGRFDEAIEAQQRAVDIYQELDKLQGEGMAMVNLALALREREQRFDLAAPPLLRFVLARLGGDRWRLVVTGHHLLTDGWSMPVLGRELLAMYRAGADAAMPPVTPYRQYLAWLARQDSGAAAAAWAQALAGLEEPTLLAPGADRAQVAVRPDTLVAELPGGLSAALERHARGRAVTVNTVLQAAWGLVAGRLSGRDDVVFGAVVAGRPPELPGVETMLGLFINTVPVRVRLDPQQTAEQMWARLQDEQSALLAYQHLGLAQIQRAAGPGAVFDTLVVYENYPHNPAGLPGAGSSPAAGADQVRVIRAGVHDATHYPLSLIVMPGARLRLRLSYRPDVFDQASAEQVSTRLVRVLEQVAADPGLPLHQVSVLSDAERWELLDGRNATAAPAPEAAVAALFATQAARAPDAVAVIDGDAVLSYRFLATSAARLGSYLAGLGAGPETVVAVAVPRSAQMITAVLGVLYSGAAYLPIDPGYPAERTGFMLADAQAVALISTRQAAAEELSEHPGGPTEPPGAETPGKPQP